MKQIKISYTNHRNETADRIIEPIETWFGTTEWHMDEQWFLKATDTARSVVRDFALLNIHGFKPVSKPAVADSEPLHHEGLTHAKMFADGGSRGNPGPSASGFVILDLDNNVVKNEGVYVGITTNNQAEYKALIFGLQAAIDMGITMIDVYMDSLLVVNQVSGTWKLKNADLMPLNAKIQILLKEFDHYTLSHVPRALNKLADAMVNECLDAR